MGKDVLTGENSVRWKKHKIRRTAKRMVTTGNCCVSTGQKRTERSLGCDEAWTKTA